MTTNSSILAYKAPWTEEPGGSKGVEHGWATEWAHTYTFTQYCSAHASHPSGPPGTSLCRQVSHPLLPSHLEGELLLAIAPRPLCHHCVKLPGPGVPSMRAHPIWEPFPPLPSEHTLNSMAAPGPTVCSGQAGAWRQWTANTRALPFLYIPRLFCFQDTGFMISPLWLMLKPFLDVLS